MRYHNITKDDMKNGDGLRVVLWTAGCVHHCKGCHNPITWDPADGLEFTDAEFNEICSILDNDYISGLTLSGGDPLFEGNRECILDLCKKIKARYPDKTIWCYTGYTWEELIELHDCMTILNYVDVLVEGRFVEELKDNTLMWKGSSNQRVIDVNATLSSESINEPILHCSDYYKKGRESM